MSAVETSSSFYRSPSGCSLGLLAQAGMSLDSLFRDSTVMGSRVSLPVQSVAVQLLGCLLYTS
ncbi:MAG: hypothetical protein MPJ25_16400, partial [Pirellulales bacterium]|nr:hypothetical protein [Pirellulales bacterium]